MPDFLVSLLPVFIVLSSLVSGLLIFAVREEQVTLRTALNLSGVTVKLLLVILMLYGVSNGVVFHFALPFLPGAPLVLHGDALSLHFITLSSVLWLATTVYAIGYLEDSPLRSRFFGYFSLCVSATVGLALAGNLITFLLFYELLTLATFPLVVHRGTPEALAAGRAVVAVRSLPRDHVLGAEDLVTEERDVSRLPRGYVADASRLLGRRLSRPVTSGSVLTPSMIEEQTIVRRGQSVTLVVRNGGFNVAMAGTALADGVQGERIRVRNEASDRVVEGLVRSSQQVEVLLH